MTHMIMTCYNKNNSPNQFYTSPTSFFSDVKKPLKVAPSDWTNRHCFHIGIGPVLTHSSTTETPASWPPRPDSTPLGQTCVAGHVAINYVSRDCSFLSDTVWNHSVRRSCQWGSCCLLSNIIPSWLCYSLKSNYNLFRVLRQHFLYFGTEFLYFGIICKRSGIFEPKINSLGKFEPFEKCTGYSWTFLKGLGNSEPFVK